MKTLQSAVIAGILVATTGVAMASSGSLSEFKPRFLPVLVQVDSHGKVTEASPANELPPHLRRLLRSNLDEMISKPATDKHGRPMASQVIINLVLKTTPNENGRYDAQFAYLSTAPVPSGSWYWVHIDGHRLALADRNDIHRRVRTYHNNDRVMNRHFNNTNSRPIPPPPTRNTLRSAPGNSAPQASRPGR